MFVVECEGYIYDFNGDQALDLAVSNFGGNDVSVLLGAGDGTFKAVVNYSAGTSPDERSSSKPEIVIWRYYRRRRNLIETVQDGEIETRVSNRVPKTTYFLSLSSRRLNRFPFRAHDASNYLDSVCFDKGCDSSTMSSDLLSTGPTGLTLNCHPDIGTSSPNTFRHATTTVSTTT